MKTRTTLLAAVAAAILGTVSSGHATGSLAEAKQLLDYINKSTTITGLPAAKIKGLLAKAINGKFATYGTASAIGSDWDAANLEPIEVQYLIEAAVTACSDGNNDLLLSGAFKGDEARVKLDIPLPRVLGTVNEVDEVKAAVAAAITAGNYNAGVNKANVYLIAKSGIGAKKAFAAAMTEQVFASLTFTTADAQAVKDLITNAIKKDKANMVSTISVVASATGEYANPQWLQDITEGAVLGNKGKVADIAAILVAAAEATGVDLATIIAEANVTTESKKTDNITIAATVASQVKAGTKTSIDAVVDMLAGVPEGNGKKFVAEAVAGATIADPDNANNALIGGIRGAYASQPDDKKGTGAALGTVAKGTGKAITYAALAARSPVGSTEASDWTAFGGADDAAAAIVTTAIWELRKNPDLDGDGIVDLGKGKSGAAKSIGKVVGEAVKAIMTLDGDPYTVKNQYISGAAAGAAVGGVAQVVDQTDTFAAAAPNATSSDFNNAMLYQVLVNVGKRVKKDLTGTVQVADAVAMAAVWIINGSGVLADAAGADTLADNIKAALDAGGADPVYTAIGVAAAKTRWADNNLGASDISWGAYGVAEAGSTTTPYSLSWGVMGSPVTDISGF